MPVQWRMKAEYLKNCNCDPGCPCDFWSDPTHHKCEGMLAMNIIEGNFGDVSLDGVKYVVTYHWPGPLHEGNGTAQPILDESTTEEQRNAIFTIMSGQAGNPWFEVLASVVSTVLEPQFAPIAFEFDYKARNAKVVVPGILETETKPIFNKDMGAENHIMVVNPTGIENREAEIGTTSVNVGTGDIKYDCPGGHSTLALVEHTEKGLV